MAVPKSDGTVRLCDDYKVSVSPVLDVDQFSLLCPEDVMCDNYKLTVNPVLDVDHFSLPCPEDVISLVASSSLSLS